MVRHLAELWLLLLAAFGLGSLLGVLVFRSLARTRFYRAQELFAAAIAPRLRSLRRALFGRERRPVRAEAADTPRRYRPYAAEFDPRWHRAAAGQGVPATGFSGSYDEEDAHWLAENPAEDWDDRAEDRFEGSDADDSPEQADAEWDEYAEEDEAAADEEPGETQEPLDQADSADELDDEGPRQDDDGAAPDLAAENQTADDKATDPSTPSRPAPSAEPERTPLFPLTPPRAAPVFRGEAAPKRGGRNLETAEGAGTRPPALKGLAVGLPDDLKRIRGIGKSNEGKLHEIGIFRWAQVAGWGEAEQRWVSAYLGFPGRVEREKWSEQAAEIVKRSTPRTRRQLFRERILGAAKRD